MGKEPKRWSGYATQSKSWQDGYDWAYGYLPKVANLDYIEAQEALGYDFDSPEALDMDKGSDYALNEQGRELFE